MQAEWRDNGRRLTQSLKQRDWRRAKRRADERAQKYDRRTMEMFLPFFGGDRKPATLSQRD